MTLASLTTRRAVFAIVLCTFVFSIILTVSLHSNVAVPTIGILLDQVNKLWKQHNDAEARVTSLTSHLKSAKTRLKELEAARDSKKDALVAAEKELKRLGALVTSTKGSISAKESEIQDLTLEWSLAVSASQRESIANAIARAQAQLASLKELLKAQKNAFSLYRKGVYTRALTAHANAAAAVERQISLISQINSGLTSWKNKASAILDRINKLLADINRIRQTE